MISIRKNFLFIHVPKTGGNSIQNILRNHSEDDIVMSENQDGIERFGVRNSKYNTIKHSTLSHYKTVLESDIYHSLFKFATLRNPWDMMASYYFSPHRGGTEWDKKRFLALVNRVQTLRHYICENPMSGKNQKGLEQQETITDNAIGAHVDYLIRFEHLNDDFKVICEKLDITYCPLQKRNSSNRTHYSKYYDDELKEVVRKKFMEEIKFGDYRFESV